MIKKKCERYLWCYCPAWMGMLVLGLLILTMPLNSFATLEHESTSLTYAQTKVEVCHDAFKQHRAGNALGHDQDQATLTMDVKSNGSKAQSDSSRSRCSKKNKELFTADPGIFSQKGDIDYEGLQKYLHYTFNNTDLLRDALHPMLPQSLQSEDMNHGKLELIGDAVLDLFIIEHLIDVLPNLKKGHIASLKTSFVRNKFLTDVFFKNLDIEKYLPYSKTSYKVCDVVEALIGAIYQDQGRKMKNAKAFAFRLIHFSLIEEEYKQFLSKKKDPESEEFLMAIKSLQMTPDQKNALHEVCTSDRVKHESPKSLLHEVLTKVFNDRLTYDTVLTLNDRNNIQYASTVTGPHIGRKMRGKGYTIKESEENAARNALNALAQGTLYEIQESQEPEKNFRVQLKEVCEFLKIELDISYRKYNGVFCCVIKRGDSVIDQDSGNSKKDAYEKAAKKACYYLVKEAKENRTCYKEKKRREWQQRRTPSGPPENTVRMQEHA